MFVLFSHFTDSLLGLTSKEEAPLFERHPYTLVSLTRYLLIFPICVVMMLLIPRLSQFPAPLLLLLLSVIPLMLVFRLHQHAATLHDLYLKFLKGMLINFEALDHYTKGHSLRVSFISLKVA